MFETLNNNQQFFVINFVIAFDQDYIFIKKSYEIKNIIIVVLK